MKLTKEKFLYQITFMPRFFPVNCYLVDEGSEFTLIDAGLSIHAKKILKIAEELKKPITRIVITHAHDDHMGALEKLKKAIPHVKIYLSRRDAKIWAGDQSLLQSEPQLPLRGGIPKQSKVKPDILVDNGDRIGSLLAIATPGHTPGMMAFMDIRTNALIAGDAFQTKGGLAVAGQLRWLFPFPALATWSKELALQSAENLLQYNPSLLAVGHGEMIKQPVEAMKKAINEAAKNEAKVGV
ncbi:MBL fold metallo-hydrolase [Alkalihalobacterium bogoriense]|uniref:MBL fold metallo-hydrolase n=1 Tax=Alkalihalobacterium bogoriense TaxID=246272 RepID=UPI00047A3577|nr:MBL fold metallo-hydrolase [Alkalihalobacterium bogoriense]